MRSKYGPEHAPTQCHECERFRHGHDRKEKKRSEMNKLDAWEWEWEWVIEQATYSLFGKELCRSALLLVLEFPDRFWNK